MHTDRGISRRVLDFEGTFFDHELLHVGKHDLIRSDFNLVLKELVSIVALTECFDISGLDRIEDAASRGHGVPLALLRVDREEVLPKIT